MVNHVRTLLLNASQSESRALTFPGEDIVPLTYRPIAVSEPLLALRRVLFGSNPDRAYINWRLREYMTILHRSRLADHMTVDDKRITYWPYDRPLGFDSTPMLGANQVRLNGAMTMQFLGDHTADDANGRLLWSGMITIVENKSFTIEAETPDRLTSTGNLLFTNNLSAPIAVPGSTVRLVFQEYASSSYDRFSITLMARPAKKLDTVLTDLKSLLGERANGRCADALFGTAAIEPFKTYKQLWLDGYPHMKLGAVLLALAKKTEETA